MTFFRFNDLTLEVKQNGINEGCKLPQLLEGLWWVRSKERTAAPPSLTLSIGRAEEGWDIPSSARDVLDGHEFTSLEGFRCLEDGGDYFLTDDASLFHIQTSAGCGYAALAPDFHHKPELLQSDFWRFGLVKLLRQQGMFGLHSACLIAPSGEGLLIVAESGSGKSTLALGLIRLGWGYLSDDAQLLCLRSGQVEAFPCRKLFYIDADDESHAYGDIPLGATVPDEDGGLRRQLGVEKKWPAQFVARCFPQLIIFPEIVSRDSSHLSVLVKTEALRNLLSQSGPFDQAFMPQHLAVLNQLMQQCSLFELKAGRDIHRNAEKFVQLLHEVKGEG